ncbi:Deoxyribonucleoside kinase [Chrysochromulina ericina virus CeV-01B]|mgnify:CR=1 FL=1|jgi:deoxyadenosine/deoxycytidine kinase|uniref:Deoxyribonucleoside kinase n=1 Tax=Chrysochromulina ericina virus CeV-01B TaxID=3070830 RepID=A0A0N7G7M0_9VIRU|nr:Deoxyribonucleoside kinase [Chrysochromulina ericina virus]ALH23161.1 Deoxyribonucleoside kinase [Chrysochromulina ericina virus CeV-01B]|tara:strand:- start:3723 stop:4427 length:705 start_codon:yes stop_codon:yes gene_type:complete
MTKILSIEGNIGSGKSSFVKVLTEYYKKTDKLNKLKIYFLEEPVNIWETIQNEKQENIIECFYRDQEKYAFSFQMMAYISRLSLLRKAMEKGYNYILTERCVNTDRNVFAKMLYDSGKIEKINYEIYIKWFDEFIEEFNNFHYIYIKTDPNIALERVNKRARTGESIPLAYLVVCDHYHNNWLDQTRQLTILDGNINRENNYDDWIKIIDDLINTSSNIPEIISSGSLEKWFDH